MQDGMVRHVRLDEDRRAAGVDSRCEPINQQFPHLELTRELARRFNNLYRPVFPDPQEHLTRFPKVLGTDGRKMSKSYDNAINLSDSESVVRQKFKTMITDPARVRR